MKKTKIANYLKTGILFISVCLLLWNCEKEVINEVSNPQSFVEEIQQAFNKEDFTKSIPYEFDVNWDLAKKEYSEELKTNYYEFPIRYSSSLTPHTNDLKKTKGNYFKSYKIIATFKNEKINFYALRVYEKISETGQSISEVNLNYSPNFNGLIHLINKNDEIVFAKKIEKGVELIKNYYAKDFKELDSLKSRAPEGDCVTVRTEHWRDYYQLSEGKYFLMHSTLLDITYEEICAYDYLPDYGETMNNDGSGGSPSGAGTYKKDCNSTTNSKGKYFSRASEDCAVKVTEDVVECDKGSILDSNGNCVEIEDEVIIDKSFEESIANCAYKLLKDNKQFNEILDKLVPKNSDYDVVFKVGASNGSGGHTSGNTNPNIKEIIITINKNHVETNSIISIAQTILHESVHARLIEQIKSIGGMNKLNEFSNLDSEIERLAAYYNKYGPKHNSPQHHFIWDNYVNEIAKGTEAIHKMFSSNYNQFHNYLSNIPGYDKDNFYKLTAKASLNETSYYKSSPDKELIVLWDSKLKALAEKITNYKTCK